MTCNWCEERNNLIDYCKFEDHRVCVECYELYRKKYPLRVDGCPYCKGTEEKMLVYIRETRGSTENGTLLIGVSVYIGWCLILLLSMSCVCLCLGVSLYILTN